MSRRHSRHLSTVILYALAGPVLRAHFNGNPQRIDQLDDLARRRRRSRQTHPGKRGRR